MVSREVPDAVWRTAEVDPSELLEVEFRPLVGGTGAASGRIELVTANLRGSRTFALIRKTFSQLTSGPHAEASRQPDHWAYWLRELTAYQSGILPMGPDLRAPRLYGAVDDVLYIEHVGDQQPSPGAAAAALGRWHAADGTQDQPWLARHQLAQRIAVSDLNWTAVDLDPQLRDVWDQREEYLSDLDDLPWGIAHGDFSTGNLRTGDPGLVAIDWATLGLSPVGFDIAHLALATLDESLLSTYLDGLGGRYEATAVYTGYRIAVLLIGASRAHWMATRSIPLPSGYTAFIRALAQ